MDEGDKKFSIDDALLEDEVWNKIRLDLKSLPIGDVKLIPGTQFIRLKHREFKIEEANAELKIIKQDSINDKPLSRYTINYKDFNRELAITFETEFPHSILAWIETGDAGFGKTGSLTTTAKRTQVLNEPYWSQNSVSDSSMRKKLGL